MPRLTFHDLTQRLIRELNRRVHSGDLTERGLARRLEASQPHIHNMLKGVRGMSVPLADHILDRLQIPLDSLLTDDEIERILEQRVRFGAGIRTSESVGEDCES
ncbi:MAG: XRE family transcriptional regulator [Bryobacterales bacterium]|nr:XRE family transcriptional regulator [Bryobacterales bacterium]